MTTPAALRELAEHIALLTKVRDASKANGGVRSIDFGKESGDAFIAALTAAIEALQLRTAASEGVEAVAWQYRYASSLRNGLMGKWLECSEAAFNERTHADMGYEYRALYTHPPEVARDAGRYRWLRNNCSVGSFSTYDPPFRLNCDEPASEWNAAIDAAISGAAGELDRG